MRTINRIQEIKEELFQFDPAIANNFKKHFSAEIDKFAEKTNKALTAYEQLDSTSTSNEQNAYIAAFIFYAIHCLIASEKLLIHGYPVPSGNQMRTAMESLAMAILCSAKNMPYYNEIKDDKFKTSKAVRIVKEKAAQLGINQDGIEGFLKQWEFYHNHSHATIFSIGHQLPGPQSAPIGALFDNNSIPFYKKEFDGRVNLLDIIDNIIDGIRSNLDNASQKK